MTGADRYDRPCIDLFSIMRIINKGKQLISIHCSKANYFRSLAEKAISFDVAELYF